MIVINFNKEYKKFYNIQEDIEITGTVVSSIIKNNYYKTYIVNSNNKKFYIYTEKNISLDYGDKIIIKGKYIPPEGQKNYKGFDYSKYLKSKKIFGSIKVIDIKLVKKNNCSKLLKKCNEINATVKEKIKENWKEDNNNIFIGLILGDTMRNKRRNYRKIPK